MKVIAIGMVLALALSGFAEARGSRTGSSGRVYYGGGHHTSSHGGHYAGGTGGSSHRGGHYVNSNTGNRYGRHK